MSAIFLSAAFLVLFLLPLHAQTNMVRQGARYLFLVETSSNTRHMSANIQKAAADLILNGLTKQLHPSDSIGLWTYNDTFHSGEFPLQLWKPEARAVIATNLVKFLRRQSYSKTPQFGSVVQSLTELVRGSEKLTVFIISAGDEIMKGTPYDVAINASYANNGPDLKKQNLPFITMLRSWHGDIIGGSVTWSPWPIDYPSFPPDPILVEKPKRVPPPPQPLIAHAPLIVIGKKPEPPPMAPETTAPAASVTTASPVPETPIAPPPVQVATGIEPPPVAVKQPLPEPPSPPSPPVAAPAVAPEASPATVPAESTPPPAMAVPAPPQADDVPASPATNAAPTGMAATVAVPMGLLVAGLCLLILGVVMILLLLRRSRAREASLITSSMDREKR